VHHYRVPLVLKENQGGGRNGRFGRLVGRKPDDSEVCDGELYEGRKVFFRTSRKERLSSLGEKEKKGGGGNGGNEKG